MYYVYFFIFFLGFIGCHTVEGRKRRGSTDRDEQAALHLPAVGRPITIFIPGGAKPVSSLLRLPGFDDSCPLGFYLVRTVGSSSGCLGKRVADVFCTVDPVAFPRSAFYVYGWSGLLSLQERERAGRELYNHIKTLRAVDKYAHAPITILTYSHGGNVALAAAIAALEDKDTTFSIDLFITMACPVVLHTEQFVSSSVFKRVIALYSKSDAFQASDPQCMQTPNNPHFPTPFFSKRRFDATPHLVQAEVKLNNRSRTGHLGFVSKKVMRYLPEVIDFLSNDNNLKDLKRFKDGSYCVSINTRHRKVEACI